MDEPMGSYDISLELWLDGAKTSHSGETSVCPDHAKHRAYGF